MKRKVADRFGVGRNLSRDRFQVDRVIAANVVRMNVLPRIDADCGCSNGPAKFENRLVDGNFADSDLVPGRDSVAERDDSVGYGDLLPSRKILEGDDYGIASVEEDDF